MVTRSKPIFFRDVKHQGNAVTDLTLDKIDKEVVADVARLQVIALKIP